MTFHDEPLTGYRIEADGFVRQVESGTGYQDRIRQTVDTLNLRPGVEVRIYRVFGPLDGWHFVDAANVHRVKVGSSR